MRNLRRFPTAGRRVCSVLAAVAFTVGVAGCGQGDEPDVATEVRSVLESVQVPLDRLSRTIEDARPRSRASMVELRAAADRVVSDLDRAEAELRAIDATTGEETRVVRQAQDALDELSALATALAVSSPSPGRIQEAAASAELAVDDLLVSRLPKLRADELVSKLRAEIRRKQTNAAQTGKASTPVGATPAAVSGSTSAPSYFSYRGPAFQAKLPTGTGWGSPAQSEPTPGELFRTSVRGPDEMFVIVDYTPFETAKFGGSAISTETVGQTAFGSATKYVFQGGRLPECQRNKCVDYIINDPSSGSGFAVLSGGPNFGQAQTIAQAVAESVTPSD